MEEVSSEEENTWAAAFRTRGSADFDTADSSSSADDEADADSLGSSQATAGQEADEAFARMEQFLADLEDEEGGEAPLDLADNAEDSDIAEAPEPAAAVPGPEVVNEEVVPKAPQIAQRAAPFPVVQGPRLPAEAVVTWPGVGKIAFHHSKGSFEATCFCHNQCVISRTANGRHVRGHGLVAGRPLGFLACWVQHAALCDSKAQHWDKDVWRATFTQAARLTARRELLELPGGTALAANERAMSPGEGEEAENLLGLL